MDERGGIELPQRTSIRVGRNNVDPGTITTVSHDGGLLSQVSNNPFFTAVSQSAKLDDSC